MDRMKLISKLIDEGYLIDEIMADAILRVTEPKNTQYVGEQMRIIFDAHIEDVEIVLSIGEHEVYRFEYNEIDLTPDNLEEFIADRFKEVFISTYRVQRF